LNTMYKLQYLYTPKGFRYLHSNCLFVDSSLSATPTLAQGVYLKIFYQKHWRGA